MHKRSIIQGLIGFSEDLDSMALEPQFKRGIILRACKRLHLTRSQTRQVLGAEDVGDWQPDDTITVCRY